MKKYLIVFLISMVPLIELRGAIPYAVGFGLPLVPSLVVALFGNMLPVPFIFPGAVLSWEYATASRLWSNRACCHTARAARWTGTRLPSSATT